MRDLDVCLCGDYRRDHVDGVGACKFNLPHNIGHNGPSNCTEFRMSEAASKVAGPYHWRDGVMFTVEPRCFGDDERDCVTIRQNEGYVVDRELLGEFVIPLDEWESIVLGVKSQIARPSDPIVNDEIESEICESEAVMALSSQTDDPKQEGGHK